MDATLRAADAVQIGSPADLSLNQRTTMLSFAGTRKRTKSGAIFASLGEICGLTREFAQKLLDFLLGVRRGKQSGADSLKWFIIHWLFGDKIAL